MTSTFTAECSCVPLHRKAALDAIINMICTDMEPFRVVEREGFLQFVTVAVPGYKLPSRDDLREKFLPGKVSALNTKISSPLAGAEYVCIALDVWTWRSTEAFLAVEATFVDSDFAAHMYLLSFTRLTGSNTGARIRCEYDATLLQWNIADKDPNAEEVVRKCGAIVASVRKSTAATEEVLSVAGLHLESHNATT
ncbi:hypothetical protein HPB52_021811 [Rhipicephalus sanguineus]|uniref:Uncharacterized protein n=1 Tax=Rhipicephalus sanguineus TaxID=34632 RepID=A0A9D4PK02_RHISA|nr:hypothetical protein HPB52_021811 [Rhipicephalus sanguineus]